MNHTEDRGEVSREMQCAFVDGQLDGAEWAAMLERLGSDAALRREICELRATKDMVRGAYAGLMSAQRGRLSSKGWRPWGIAAALVAAVAAGWAGHALLGSGDLGGRAGMGAAALHGVTADHVLLHISSGNRETLATALDEVEDLLRSARSEKRSIEVEIVANSSGLDLLRVGASPYRTRIAALRREFPNLSFVACHQTIERLREHGVTVELLPGVEVAPSALDQVVKRLQGGWVYIRA
jgi:intracellular sulfur oxidation DsrE/DsrF family protein